jgi:hypothetical protein
MEEKHLVSNRTIEFTWLENKSKCIKKCVAYPQVDFLTEGHQKSIFNTPKVKKSVRKPKIRMGATRRNLQAQPKIL